jgi:hypothetical protein
LRGPGEVLTAELADYLRQHKAEILEAARRCPNCTECGAVIAPGEPECWWGRDRVHGDCGRRAWAREWKGKAPPADTLGAMAH